MNVENKKSLACAARRVAGWAAFVALVGVIWRYDLWHWVPLASTIGPIVVIVVFGLLGAFDDDDAYGVPDNVFRTVSGSVEWEVDVDAITVRNSGNRRESLRMPYGSLEAVYIRTTSLGPFLEDFFYVLDDGETSLEVPLSVACEHGLADHLFALPGFDHGAVVAASVSIDDQLFVAWQRQANGAV